MTSAVDSPMDSTQVLLLRSESIAEKIKWPGFLVFAHILELAKHVCENIKSIDTFTLIVPIDTIPVLLADPIYKSDQVRQIYGYYSNNVDLKQVKDNIQDHGKKLRFCHARNLSTLILTLKVTNTLDLSRHNYQGTKNDAASTQEERLANKRSNPNISHASESKRVASTSNHGLSVKVIEQVNPPNICPSCKALFCNPYQLICGHRICQGCIQIDNNETVCLICFEISSTTQCRPDRGLRNDMQQLLTTCLQCNWTGNLESYQEHLAQKHPDGGTDTTVLDVYAQQGNTNETPPHPTISYMLPSSHPILMSDSNSLINEQYRVYSVHVQEMINDLAKHVNTAINHSEQNEYETCRLQTLLENLSQRFFSLQQSPGHITAYIREMKAIGDRLTEEFESLKQTVHDTVTSTSDGTYTWKITNVSKKIDDAQAGRQKAIYSPPFYSSSTGYKMCMRLYFNGDSRVRGTHLSLFFVLMRSNDDAVLNWPFSYKISLRLIDQSTSDINKQSNISHAFSPDLQLNCFQRPNSDMNEGYGIKNFMSVTKLKENFSRYIKDNIMIIEMKIISSGEQTGQSSTFLLLGKPNDEDHADTLRPTFAYID